jgi:hypothetical protein
MKISVYKKADYSAKSKEDKNILSKLSSFPNLPETITVSDIDSLITAITSYAWSPSVFEGKRHNDNFISADFMAVDFDNGLRIEEAEKIVQRLGLAALCLPSSSHTPEHHKFRLVFPMAKTISSKKIYDDTWDYLLGLFPMIDPSCSDYARYYIRSSMDDGFYQDGDFLLPVENEVEKEREYNMSDVQVEVTEDIAKTVEELYGKNRRTISESVAFFLKEAHTGLPGLWINSLNAAVFSLSLSGLDESVIMELVEQLAPNPLDKKDLYQIKRSCRDGRHKREI